MLKRDSEPLLEAASLYIEEARRLALEGPKRFKSNPWQEEKLLWSHIRDAMAEASSCLELYAKDRFSQGDMN